MDVLRRELSDALDQLEQGDEDEAHDIIEEHVRKAVKIRSALEEFEEELDRHIDEMDELSSRTEQWDIDGVEETVDELRESVDEESKVHEAFRRLQDVFEKTHQ